MTNKTRVAVLGTLADLHREPIRYNLACLTRLVGELNPDLLCAELPRAAWESGDVSGAPIEYREALIPLAARANIMIVPIQSAAGCELVMAHSGGMARLRRAILRRLDGLLRWFQLRADGPRAIHSGAFGHLCHTICLLEAWVGGPATRHAWDAANRALLENVLAAVRRDPGVRVESNVLLSVGDKFGPASRSCIMDEIVLPYTVLVNGRLQAAHAFSGAAHVIFPPPLGRRTAYLFPFSDQVFFHDTLGAYTALARLALDPPWLGRALAALVRLGVPSLMRRRKGGRARFNRLVGWLQQRYAGHDWYGLVVEVQGTGGTVRVSLRGHGQADATAIGAAALARALYEGEIERPGIWLAEQIVPPGPFLDRLAARGLVPLIEIALAPQPVG